jgi:hypothetical protein
MFKRLNQAVLKFMGKRSGDRPVIKVTCKAQGFTVSSAQDHDTVAQQNIGWAQVKRIVALNSPSLVGEDFVLLVEHGNATITLAPDAAGWEEFLAACESHLPGALPRREWQTRLIALESGTPVEVFRAD